MAEPKHPESAEAALPAPGLNAGVVDTKDKHATLRSSKVTHPSGKESHGQSMQILRGLAVAIYFATCCMAYVYQRQPASEVEQADSCSILITQLIGSPLYFVNRDWYYAYMAMTKRSFAITTTVMTSIWGPTKIRISGDASVAGQIRPTEGGGVEFDFPERMVLIANHQVHAMTHTKKPG